MSLKPITKGIAKMKFENSKDRAEIIQLANVFQKSRILLTAFELDVFSRIADTGSTAEQIAGNEIKNIRALKRLLNALHSLGLVKKEKENYFLTESSSAYLVKGKENYLEGLMHSVHLWNSWSKLTETVLNEVQPLKNEINDRGEEWLRAFINAMHMRGRSRASEVAAYLDFSKVKKILDVGGGSAAFSTEFIESKPDMKAVVFDLPNVVPITKEFISKDGMDDSIDTLTGNYLVDDLGSNYDMIFLSAIIHSNSFKENELLIKKCGEALNPGGQIVIVDYIMNEERTEPAAGAFFAINMLMNTEAGDTYTLGEIKEWFSNCGIDKTKLIEISEGNSILKGKK